MSQRVRASVYGTANTDTDMTLMITLRLPGACWKYESRAYRHHRIDESGTELLVQETSV